MCEVVKALIFLARQNIAIRGSTVTNPEAVIAREPNSNLSQLLKLMGSSTTDLEKWLQSKVTYTSPDNINELLNIMGQMISRKLTSQIREDGLTRTSVAHEEFLGLYHVDKTGAVTLFITIKDVTLRLGLPLDLCRGQCYDSASVMSGVKNGAAAKVLEVNPKALYVHCYAHSLNLAVQDTTKDCSVMRDSLDLCNELIKLITSSPKREAWLETIKKCSGEGDSAGKVKRFSSTRWTVKASAMKRIIDNYGSIQTLLDEIYDDSSDRDTSAKVLGLSTKMEQYDFLFGLILTL
ncbi:zinc finger MYM-type protein 1-like [Watersipora subatra]|uniref:zinc finger MYM-type protein 1-like n=1 Tax=Watersipora subatra TaxID=2589382 RepID=UPI00355B8EE2